MFDEIIAAPWPCARRPAFRSRRWRRSTRARVVQRSGKWPVSQGQIATRMPLSDSVTKPKGVRDDCDADERVGRQHDHRGLRDHAHSRRRRRGHLVLQTPLRGSTDRKRRNSAGICSVLPEIPQTTMNQQCPEHRDDATALVGIRGRTPDDLPEMAVRITEITRVNAPRTFAWSLRD